MSRRLITFPLLILFTILNSRNLYAQEAASMPIELQEGQVAPFTGFLLSLDLGKKMMSDSQLSLQVPLLKQLNDTNHQIIQQQTTQITDLKQDKQNLTDANQKMQDDYKAANNYNGWIFGGFFALGVIVSLGLVLVTGYAMEKVNSGKSGLMINNSSGIHF